MVVVPKVNPVAGGGVPMGKSAPPAPNPPSGLAAAVPKVVAGVKRELPEEESDEPAAAVVVSVMNTSSIYPSASN